jgi:prepilin-type N-terminal cleavage/methylation domain-containing protein
MKSQRSNNAFTLIELLVALALSALLLVAVLFVTASMARARTALNAKSAAADPLPPAAWEMLCWDLSNASQMTAEPNRLILKGFGSLQSATLALTQRPVDIEYSIRIVDQKPWLVRRQVNLDSLSNHNELLELVCFGVEHFEVADGGAVTTSTRPQPTTSTTSQGSPHILKFRMTMTGTTKGTIEKTMVID